MMSVTRWTEATISPMVAPALCTSAEPSATRPTESSIRPLISLAALAERWARVRTSEATTAKPRPCSPARAASTAALSARILVWKAMPSMTEMISAIFFEDFSISPMVVTTLPTTSPPCEATEAAPIASWLAWRACSAFWRTVEVSSSIEAAVSSRLAACCSVRPRQVAVARGDFARRRVDRDGRLLDAADDLGQLFGGGIGIVAHPRKHALEVAVDTHRQVALRQRGQQVGNLLDGGAVGVEQAVELLCQLQEEAFLAVQRNAASQVAGSGGLDDTRHFIFDLDFDATVAPFADRAHRLAVGVADHRDDLCNVGIAIAHLAARRALLLQLGNELRIDLAAMLEHSDAMADQRGIDLEARQRFAEVVGVLLDDLVQRRVGVDHLERRVGNR